MGEHARPRISGRHRKPGMPARAAAVTAAAATGTATAGVIFLAGHASAAPVVAPAIHAAQVSTSTRTEETVIQQQINARLLAHLAHLRHVVHLRHVELIKQEKAQQEKVHLQLAARPAAPHAYGTYSYGELESLRRSAGGASWAANTAACIAEHESGGNPGAISPTDDFGLWQINGSHGAMASLNPGVNVHSAIIISNDGTNWGPWTTAPDCGV